MQEYQPGTPEYELLKMKKQVEKDGGKFTVYIEKSKLAGLEDTYTRKVSERLEQAAKNVGVWEEPDGKYEPSRMTIPIIVPHIRNDGSQVKFEDLKCE
jgi:hypothetical protein